MRRNEDELARLREAFTAPATAAWLPAGCPEPDRIWEAVRGELPPAELRQVVEHVAVCASCAEDWRIAMAFEEEARKAREAAPEPAPARSALARARPWLTAVAATLLIAVVGIQIRPEPKPVYRSGSGAEIESRLPAGESLPRRSFVLAWEPVAGAESYDLLVSNASDLRPIADLKRLTTTHYQVPESALAGLSAGARLLWKVTAVFPDGGKTASKTFTTALE
jgi:hypothetical protein